MKLLRVLEEGTFRAVGSSEEKKVSVRIVAATNRELHKMVAQGKFREDLYYRINVITINYLHCGRGRKIFHPNRVFP